jgi:hypothetical protein
MRVVTRCRGEADWGERVLRRNLLCADADMRRCQRHEEAYFASRSEETRCQICIEDIRLRSSEIRDSDERTIASGVVWQEMAEAKEQAVRLFRALGSPVDGACFFRSRKTRPFPPPECFRLRH